MILTLTHSARLLPSVVKITPVPAKMLSCDSPPSARHPRERAMESAKRQKFAKATIGHARKGLSAGSGMPRTGGCGFTPSPSTKALLATYNADEWQISSTSPGLGVKPSDRGIPRKSPRVVCVEDASKERKNRHNGAVSLGRR